MSDFIEKLNLSEEDKLKVRSLGLDSPPALMGIILAVPQAINDFIGKDTVDSLKEELEVLLTDEEKIILAQKPEE